LEKVGVSVISDIDDTIKYSNILNRKALLRETFIENFSAISGMSDLYSGWGKNGAAFHYVSGSPWALAQHLEIFLHANSFPRGSLHLRHVRSRLKDFYRLSKSPDAFKREVIEGILKHFPNRRFILVGDSGEKDPEVYGEIARKFPGQIERIFIRDVAPGHLTPDRQEIVFKDVGRDVWTIFEDAAEVKK
jgi:phosphatidate phosphatase APP1